MTAKVLQICNLTKSFGGVRAVNDVSFDLEPGQLTAMIGPNGAGKTTCFNLINGQLKPDSGSVAILGQDISGLKPHHIWRLGVGRTFQITATFVSMSVLENVQMARLSFHRRTLSVMKKVRHLYVDESLALLKLVGIENLRHRACGVLAYGDLKRLELAMALANNPKLLLMDEPTAGMGAGERARLMELIAAIVTKRRIGVLFTEHDMDAVFAHAHRIIVLNHGELIAQGAPPEIHANAHVREVYLGDAESARLMADPALL